MKKRQIVFIMTDTTRFDMVGCYGYPDMKTPNIDALAKDGLICERAYTCQPVCGPARSSIFTGLYPHSNGSFTNSYPLGANVKTIGQRLSDNGIKTAYVGKWHLDGGDYFGLGRCPEGWDPEYWYDMRCYLDELDENDRLRSRKPRTNAEGIGEEFTYAHRCADRAIKFLNSNSEEDFFLVLSLDEPHDPCLCPEPYASMYRDYEFPKSPNVYDTLENKPYYQKLWAAERLHADRSDLKIKPAYFLGCNSFADYEIGRVTEVVRKLAPDALIIFTSDHGDALQSHRLVGKGASVYDEIARIPLIFSGNVAKGNYPYPVSHINLAPTILEYMGIPVPKLMEGKSVLPILSDKTQRINDYVYIEFTRYEVDHDGFGGLQMMRGVYDGRYKLAIHLLDETDEFYDLAEDPYEMNNLIYSEKYKAERDRLHDALLLNMDVTRDPFRGYQWETRKWRIDAPEPNYENHGYTRQRENEEYEPRQLDYSTGLPFENATRIKKLGK